MIQNLNNVKIPNNFNGKNKVKVQLWYIVWFFFFRPSPHMLNSFRVLVLRLFGAKVGKGLKIKPSAYISYPWNFVGGDYTYIGDNVFIDSLTSVSVGNNVSISNGVYITSGTHNSKSEFFDLVLKPVCISDESWLCVKSVVLPGASIGSGSIIGACALVSEGEVIPDNQVWVGLPARYVKNRI